MNELKFHILLPYYKRPEIVSNALNSIINSDYTNWYLTFIDDSGNRGFEELFNGYGFREENAEYVPINMSDEEKSKNGGSIFGSFINDAIKRVESDIIIILCDDDALTKNYMKDLNEFYKNNPQTMWSYCHVLFYNPNEESYENASPNDRHPHRSLEFLNNNRDLIHPRNKVDSSQVTFRRKVFIDYGVQFMSPRTANLDAEVFREAHHHVGDCQFNNIVGQCKASFPDQLGLRISSRRGEYLKV
jgi:glycosyltransferase involved in cell wall biosynthesis